MTGNEMTAEDLVDYANALLATMDAAELTSVESLHPCAVTIARAANDGLIDPDGVTDLGHQHLTDLYNDYENGGE